MWNIYDRFLNKQYRIFVQAVQIHPVHQGDMSVMCYQLWRRFVITTYLPSMESRDSVLCPQNATTKYQNSQMNPVHSLTPYFLK